MATRTVMVRLTASAAQFNNAMNRAGQTAARNAALIRARMNDAARNSTASLGRVARAAQRSETSIKAARTASLGLLAVFGAAAYTAARFEKAMSQVKAVTGATGPELMRLRQAALEAGRTTQYSATQAAEAEAELGRAGIKTADIVGGALKGSLALAAAGQIDLSEAAIVSAQAMNTFGLSGKDMSHVADVLAAGANKSATDVHQMGMAIRMGGLVAHQTGLSLEETAGAIAAFADHALIGSDAGTSLKVMLQRLTPQSKEAQAMMDKLGFSAYDSSGKFVGLSELAQRLHDSFKNLSPEARNAAFSVIFGSDAVRSATILYQLGAKGIDKYTKAVDDNGYAMRTARTQMDNLVGDFELLKSALEVALIQSGSAANSVLRGMVQWVTKLVNAYNNLPPGLQQTATLLVGLAGALGLAGASMLLLLPRIMTVRRELVALGVTGARARTAMMGLGRLSLVVAGLEAVNWATEHLTGLFKDAPPNVTKLANSLVDLGRKGKAAGELTKAFGKNLDGFGDAVRRVAHPSGMERLINSMEKIRQFGDDDVKLAEAKDKIKALDQALADLVRSGSPDVAAQAFSRMAREAEAQGTSTEKLRSLLPEYSDALAATDTQNKLAAGSQGRLGDELKMTADEMQDQRSAAEKLSDALNALNGVAISAAEKEIDFRQSLSDLTSAVKENGHSLDVTSEKGRKVKSAFLDAAKAAMEHAQAVADQKDSVEAGNAVLEKDIGALKRTMRAAGFTDSQIRKLTAAYAQLPPSKYTKVRAPGADRSISQMVDLKKRVEHVPPGKTITVKAPTKTVVDALRNVGYKVEHLPNRRIRITAPTKGAQDAVRRLRDEINRLRNRQIKISITKYFRSVGNPQGMKNALEGFSEGGIVGRAANGLYIPGYAPRVDNQPILASRGEGVLVPETVRKLGLASGLGPAGVVKALNRWGRYGGTDMSGIISGRLLAFYRSRQPGGSSTPQHERVVTYQIYPRMLQMTVRDLEVLQRRQEALARVGRPR